MYRILGLRRLASLKDAEKFEKEDLLRHSLRRPHGDAHGHRLGLSWWRPIHLRPGSKEMKSSRDTSLFVGISRNFNEFHGFPVVSAEETANLIIFNP